MGELLQRAKPLQIALFILALSAVLEGLLIARLGDQVLAALAQIIPIFLLVDAIGYGFGAALIAQYLKLPLSQRPLFAQRQLVRMVALGGMLCIVIICLYLVHYWLQAPRSERFDYLYHLLWFFPAQFANHTLWALLRANHETRLAAFLPFNYGFIVLSLTAIWVIYFPTQSLQPHAWLVTAAAWFSALQGLWLLRRRKIIAMQGTWTRNRRSQTLEQHPSQRCGHHGVLITLANLSVPFASVLVIQGLEQYAPFALSGFAIALKIEGMLLVIFYGLSAVMGPRMVELYHSHQQIQSFLLHTFRYCIVCGLMIAALCLVTIPWVASALSCCPQATNGLHNYFLWVPWSYAFYGMVMLGTAIFNVQHKTHWTLAICFGRLLILAIGIVLLGPVWHANGIFLAIAISHLLSALTTLYLLKPQWAGHQPKEIYQ